MHQRPDEMPCQRWEDYLEPCRSNQIERKQGNDVVDQLLREAEAAVFLFACARERRPNK